jgi:TonB family protein
MIKPHIPNPCPENWDRMKIGLHSRFCENCKKDVVDFTSMSRQEILEIIFSNHNKQVCGRFRKSQLDFSHTDLLITINALSKDQKNTNLAFYLLAVGTLVLMGCKDSDRGEKHKSTISVDFDSRDDRNEYDLETKKDKEKSYKDRGVMGVIVCPIVPPVPEDKPDTIGTKYIPKFDLKVSGPPEATDEPEPYALVDEMPEFYGGITALSDYLRKNLKYPEWERKNKTAGTVYVTFMVNKDGKIKYPRILKSVEGSKNFDQEVIRVIQNMPLWKPGRLRKIKVNVQYHLPIKFIL